jgi:isopenicillin N synthase-like dioxygenase
MGDSVERKLDRVYYTAGGFNQSRPILTGSDAKETFDKIPIIDFTDIFSSSLEARQKLAKEVGHAAQHVGFFYAINTPMSIARIDTIFKVIAEFFHQPEEVKMQIECNKSNAAQGYIPRQQTGPHGVVRESFAMGNDYTEPEQQHISTAPDGSVPLNQWPDETVPKFRSAIYAYCKFRACDS